MKDFVYADDGSNSWFYERYYYAGANMRFWTFQAALNVLYQRGNAPVIVETGCQRLEEDLGSGMSTSIFAEFCSRHGGRVYTVDNNEAHLGTCRACTERFGTVSYELSDSITWLRDTAVGPVDLLYLDSYDHPMGELLNIYDGQVDIEAAMKTLASIGQEEILRRHGKILEPCQQHCLNELTAATESGVIGSKTLILIDDNQLPGGGKPRLAKDALHQGGWICLLDQQQTLWAKEL